MPCCAVDIPSLGADAAKIGEADQSKAAITKIMAQLGRYPQKTTASAEQAGLGGTKATIGLATHCARTAGKEKIVGRNIRQISPDNPTDLTARCKPRVIAPAQRPIAPPVKQDTRTAACAQQAKTLGIRCDVASAARIDQVIAPINDQTQGQCKARKIALAKAVIDPRKFQPKPTRNCDLVR